MVAEDTNANPSAAAVSKGGVESGLRMSLAAVLPTESSSGTSSSVLVLRLDISWAVFCNICNAAWYCIAIVARGVVCILGLLLIEYLACS